MYYNLIRKPLHFRVQERTFEYLRSCLQLLDNKDISINFIVFDRLKAQYIIIEKSLNHYNITAADVRLYGKLNDESAV